MKDEQIHVISWGKRSIEAPRSREYGDIAQLTRRSPPHATLYLIFCIPSPFPFPSNLSSFLPSIHPLHFPKPSISKMSQSQDIQRADSHLDVAPTPQNTPLETGVLQNRPANLGQPSVETLQEGEESEEDEEAGGGGGANPASLLAQVSLMPGRLMWGDFRFRSQKGGEAEWRWRDHALRRKFLGWSSIVQ